MSFQKYYLVPIKVENGNIISDFALAVKYEKPEGSLFNYDQLKFYELTKTQQTVDLDNYNGEIPPIKIGYNKIIIANKYSTVGELLNAIPNTTENSLNEVEMDMFNYDYMDSNKNIGNETQYFLLPIDFIPNEQVKDVGKLTKEHIKNIFKDPTNTDYDYVLNEIPGDNGESIKLDKNVYVYKDGIVYPF